MWDKINEDIIDLWQRFHREVKLMIVVRSLLARKI
jgi:hypothetical protein